VTKTTQRKNKRGNLRFAVCGCDFDADNLSDEPMRIAPDYFCAAIGILSARTSSMKSSAARLNANHPDGELFLRTFLPVM
jgi:hypothetical protein